MNDESIDAQSRAIIRYAMEINDPWLARLVRRVDAGKPIGDNLDFDSTETENEVCNKERLKALTEFICRAGDEPETKSAALLVLMGTIENSAHPKAVANTVKHLAFTHCGELNLFGMVEAQIAVAKGDLLASDPRP